MVKSKPGPKPVPPIERIVRQSIEIPCLVKGIYPLCWIFTGHLCKGYGQIHANGRTGYAHQEAYKALIGPIPDGLEPDHLCRTPACWNPWHLDYVPHTVNIQRGRWGRYDRATSNWKRRT